MVRTILSGKSLTILAGAFAIGTLVMPAPAGASDEGAGFASEFSAQTFNAQKGKGGGRPAPQRAAPRPAAPRTFNARPAPRTAGPRPAAPRTVGPRPVAPRTAGPRPGGPGPRVVGRPGGPPRAVTFSGPRTVYGGRMRGAGRFVVGGRNFTVWRGRPYRINRGGRFYTFVGLGTLGAIAVGAATYYPYAYLDAPQPLCDGITDDGCQMMWQDVPTVDGGAVAQCVAFCPWQQ